MKHNICNFVGLLTITTLMFGATPGFAAVPSNPRGASVVATARARGGVDAGVKQRSADRVVLRNVTVRGDAPERVMARGATTNNTVRGVANVERTGGSAANVSRSAASRSVSVPANLNRSVTTNGASRSALPRATAVFNDVTKIGGGYAACRDSYATCMDQFCANANDTYRRCFCSARFTDFRNFEDSLDEAKTLLMEFEDDYLNAVDKTADEVSSMYTATAGEKAVKKDKTKASQILDQIGDLLSGKKSVSTQNYTYKSLELDNIDEITGEIDDIWGAGTSGSIFTSGLGKNLADLEGDALYRASNKQCVSLMADNCSSDAVLQMARSAYNIMITQDCNAYEKKINKQKESVKQTVRTAEKYLRDARLEEYRSHNSTDVNDCIARVKTAILNDSACGDGYKRCLDNTGVYINSATGEPNYTPRLFKLTELINLNGVTDNVLAQNPEFDKFLDSKRKNAESALDTCRSIQNTVWDEFKRSALIEIAQAQDEKIESVKMSCVSAIAKCYDSQLSQLKDLDLTERRSGTAAAIYTTGSGCRDKVIACAALYGDTDGCVVGYDGKVSTASGKTCGMQELIKFVEIVDDSRVAESCSTVVKDYLADLCTPDDDSVYTYPYLCRNEKLGTHSSYTTLLTGLDDKDYNDDRSDKSLWAQVGRQVRDNCMYASLTPSVRDEIDNMVQSTMNNTIADMQSILSGICNETYGGYWNKNGYNNYKEVTAFYNSVVASNNDPYDWGKCQTEQPSEPSAANAAGRVEETSSTEPPKATCPAGTYSNVSGATDCTPCSAGTYQPKAGQTSCIPADPGHFVKDAGATEQTVCSAGTYQPKAGQTSCIPADPGHFVKNAGATQQTACVKGSYTENTGAVGCNPCFMGVGGGWTTSGDGTTNHLDCNVRCPNVDYVEEWDWEKIKWSDDNNVNVCDTSIIKSCKKREDFWIYYATNKNKFENVTFGTPENRCDSSKLGLVGCENDAKTIDRNNKRAFCIPKNWCPKTYATNANAETSERCATGVDGNTRCYHYWPSGKYMFDACWDTFGSGNRYVPPSN